MDSIFNSKSAACGWSWHVLTENDIPSVLEIMYSNSDYFRHDPPLPDTESIRRDMNLFPEGCRREDKHYLGCFRDGRLAAVLDLIEHYPFEQCAWIGFFMIHSSLQNKGYGSELVRNTEDVLFTAGYKEIQLAYITSNIHAEHFWKKNGYHPEGTVKQRGSHQAAVLRKRTGKKEI